MRDDLYRQLQVSSEASFGEIKKAYYRCAKACHPDLHCGSRQMEEQFLQVVHAFDVLLDPLQRSAYDKWCAEAAKQGKQSLSNFHVKRPSSIMDSPADDILEELIVGNRVPTGSSLQTLLTDLEGTEWFMTFREGKTYFYKGNYDAAYQLFRRCTGKCGVNILYHYYMAEAAMKLGRYRRAHKHFQRCLDLGQERVPIQRLERVHRRMVRLRDKRHGILAKVINMIAGKPELPAKAGTDAVIAETNRAMARLLREAEKEDREKNQKRLR